MKGNNIRLLVFRNSARRGFLAIKSNAKVAVLGPTEEKVGPHCFKSVVPACTVYFIIKNFTIFPQNVFRGFI
jgi:hypothetical protein